MFGVHRSAIYRATATAKVYAMESQIDLSRVCLNMGDCRSPFVWTGSLMSSRSMEGWVALALRNAPSIPLTSRISFRRDRGNAAVCWAAQWDLSNWSVLSFLVGGCRVGGAVLAFDASGGGGASAAAAAAALRQPASASAAASGRRVDQTPDGPRDPVGYPGSILTTAATELVAHSSEPPRRGLEHVVAWKSRWKLRISTSPLAISTRSRAGNRDD